MPVIGYGCAARSSSSYEHPPNNEERPSIFQRSRYNEQRFLRTAFADVGRSETRWAVSMTNFHLLKRVRRPTKWRSSLSRLPVKRISTSCLPSGQKLAINVTINVRSWIFSTLRRRPQRDWLRCRRQRKLPRNRRIDHAYRQPLFAPLVQYKSYFRPGRRRYQRFTCDPLPRCDRNHIGYSVQ